MRPETGAHGNTSGTDGTTGRPILLVEFTNADQFPGRVSYNFPFIKGYLSGTGIPVRWTRFAVPTDNLRRHGRDEITLPKGEFAALIRTVEDHRAGLVLMTDPLCRRQQVSLARAVTGGAVVVAKDPSARQIPELAGYTGFELLDRTGLRPEYDWEPGNPAAARREMDNIYLVLRRSCGHQARVQANPIYRDLAGEGLEERIGCAFCDNWTGCRVSNGRRGSGRWVEIQIEAIAVSRATTGRRPNALLLEQFESPSLMRRCVAAMRRCGLTGDIRLLTAVRSDQARSYGKVAQEVLDGSHDGDVRLGVYACGIESFDPDDLMRFNKGTRPIDGLTAVNTFRQLARRHPDRFDYTGLSFIAFTPWTTVTSLHRNASLVRLLGLQGAGNFFQARLRLHPGLPVTALAARDGLIAVRETDPVLVMNRSKLFPGELAWSFADDRLRPVSRIVIRLLLADQPDPDRLTREISARLNREGIELDITRADLLLKLLECMLEELLARPAVSCPDEIELLECGLARLSTARTETAEPFRRRRLGTRRLDVTALGERLGPLLAGGTKPVVSIELVEQSELIPGWQGRLKAAGLAFRMVDRYGREASEGTLLLSTDDRLIERRARLEPLLAPDVESAGRHPAILEAGRMHGCPECCTRAYAGSAAEFFPTSGWEAAAWRCRNPGRLARSIHPLLAPAIGFIPCSPECRAADDRYREWFRLLGVEMQDSGDEGRVMFFELDAPGDGQSVAVRGAVGRTGAIDNFRFAHPTKGEPAAGVLGRLFAEAETIRIEPWQVVAERDGSAVGVAGGGCFPWSHERAWHPAEWLELARGISLKSDPRPIVPVRQQRGVEDRTARRALLALAAALPGLPPGISIGQVVRGPEPGRVSLELGLPGGRCLVLIHPRGSLPSPMLSTGHFDIEHAAATPPGSRWDIELIRRLLTAWDRLLQRVDNVRLANAPGGEGPDG